jgi:hypothetical protein
MTIRPIPNDVAHCPGMPWQDFGVQPECLSCARYQPDETGDRVVWMAPPESMPCEMRLPE